VVSRLTASLTPHSGHRSAVGLGDQGPGLFIGQHWCDLPIKALGPLGSMLVAGIRVVGLHKDPTLNGAWPVQTFPGRAPGERRTRRQELLGSNFVIAGLERPVHQKGHGD